MSEEQTTKTTEQESQQQQTVQATPEEQERNRQLIAQENALRPQSTALQRSLFDLSTALARGGELPGFFGRLSEGLTPETIDLAAGEAVQDVLPSFQGLGILDSGTAFTGATKAATGERVAGEKFNLALLGDLLGTAFSGSQVPLQTGFQQSDLLSRTLAGLRGQTITGASSGQTQLLQMNPFLKSFQQSAGQTLGSPKFDIGGFGFGG